MNYKIVIIFSFVLLSACKKKDPVAINQSLWTSSDPLIIPYAQRINMYNSGNLVFNHSFENGKNYFQDGNLISFNIDGWKNLGSDEIEWVNTDYDYYDEDESYHKNHAVKICRLTTDETEELGVGVLSDFIRVIPGNYELSYHIRLENICSGKERLGRKLYDAVNLRLLYFDKNKLEIGSSSFNPDTDSEMDHGYKSLSFSNYYSIHELQWVKVRGLSAFYPFFNNDIPDEARYVKIFAGLKGTGTMWIDDVSFQYSKRNFSYKELIEPMYDSLLLPVEKLTPTPQNYEQLNTIRFFDGQKESLPVIVIPENCTPDEKKLAVDFRKSLIDKIGSEAIGSSEIEIKTQLDDDDRARLVFSVNKNNVYNKMSKVDIDSLLNDKKEGYVIQNYFTDNHYVLLNALDKGGLEFGFQTLANLIDSVNYYAADIFDYPSYPERSLMINSNTDSINLKEIAEEYRFNQFYVKGVNDDYLGRDISKVLYINLMDLITTMQSHNKEITRRNLLVQLRKVLPENLQEYQELCLEGTYQPVKQVCCADLISFTGVLESCKNIQQEHIDLIDAIADYVKSLNPEIRIGFVPPWNTLDQIFVSQGQARYYFADFKKDTLIDKMYFYGNDDYSGNLDAVNYDFLKSFTNKDIFFINNSLGKYSRRLNLKEFKNLYKGKFRLCFFYEPIMSNSPFVSKSIINIEKQQYLNEIQLSTISDYLWNEEYEPEYSLWKNLVRIYGRETAMLIIEINDTYINLYESILYLENNDQVGKYMRQVDFYGERLENQISLLKKVADHNIILNQIIKNSKELINRSLYFSDNLKEKAGK